MRDLADRTALVTGASRGIGIYIVRALIKERMKVVLSGVSEIKLRQSEALLSERGAKVASVVADLGDRSAIESLVSTAFKKFGSIDVLVNNAAVETIFPYHKLCLDDIERVLRINLIGSMLLTRLVLPEMLRHGYGHVINMSSLSGKAAPPYFEPYAATKAGLIAFTESLRVEYSGTGIGFSVICPGFVEAGIYQRLIDETGQTVSRLLGTSSPEAVASAVVTAIKKNRPEIIINPGPTRLLTTLAELSPILGEWLVHRIGATEWFKKIAYIRQSKQMTDGDTMPKQIPD